MKKIIVLHTAFFTTLILLSNMLHANPDVGFPDTDAYLEIEYHDTNSALLKFKMNGVVEGIVLPNTYYNLQALRNFARGFAFSTPALKDDVIFMLGNDGEAFGNSFSSAILAKTFLNEVVRFLASFDAAQAG